MGWLGSTIERFATIHSRQNNPMSKLEIGKLEGNEISGLNIPLRGLYQWLLLLFPLYLEVG
jgi:hypothetical protein